MDVNAEEWTLFLICTVTISISIVVHHPLKFQCDPVPLLSDRYWNELEILWFLYIGPVKGPAAEDAEGC